MATPTTITHEELMAALQPLFELLDVSQHNIYASPGITIGPSHVGFNVVVPADSEDGEAFKPRAPGIRALSHPNNEYAELSYYVEVEVSGV